MNIAEIAKIAGVSPATVSRFLNDGYVSAEKREKIAKVISQTGYTPLASAQTLRTRKNYLIGVVVPKISSESVSRMVDGISEVLGNTKYNIFLGNTDLSMQKELDFLSIFKNDIVDGVIYIATTLTKKHSDIINSCGKPVVVLGQFDKRYPCVYHDDFGGAKGAVLHLAERGCKKIGCISVPIKDKAAGKDRLDGYLEALSEAGLRTTPQLIAEGDFSLESGCAAAKTIFDAVHDCDGLFCASDNMAVGAANYLKTQGITNVKIVGVGDSKLSKAVTPPLTSVHLFYKTAGQEAANMLLEILDKGEAITKQLKLGFRLMERGSTDI